MRRTPSALGGACHVLRGVRLLTPQVATRFERVDEVKCRIDALEGAHHTLGLEKVAAGDFDLWRQASFGLRRTTDQAADAIAA